MSALPVLDVTFANFKEVVRQSEQVPVLLDFWAEWCGPCKTLGPVLESLAQEYGGAFVLGKVDTEKEPDLAHAFQVQSIPFVVLLAGGRPVDAFAGNVPEKEVRAFLARAGIDPLGEPAPTEDPDSPESKLLVGKRAIVAGDMAAAAEVLGAIEAESEVAGERDRLVEGLALFDATLDAGGPPAAASLLRAREALLARQVEPAMEAILESIGQDAGFADGLARKAMLLCFSLLGEDSDTCGDYRRRMATLLY